MKQERSKAEPPDGVTGYYIVKTGEGLSEIAAKDGACAERGSDRFRRRSRKMLKDN